MLGALLLVWARPGRAGAASGGDGMAAWVEAASPERLCPGEGRRVAVRLRNIGVQGWSPARRDHVAYHWLRDDGTTLVRDGERTPLPGPVAPGQTVEVDARLRAPAQAGRYRLVWALVREGVRWVETPEPGAWVEVAGTGPALAWSRVAGGRPAEARAGQRVEVSMVVRNVGCTGWSAEQHDALAFHWFDRDGRLRVREGLRSPLPALGPGEQAEIVAVVQAPPEAGDYALQWRPVRERMQWFPADDPLVWVTVAAASRAWSIDVTAWPASLSAGGAVETSLWLRNEGDAPWSAEEGDALSYRWYDASGAEVAEGPRTTLPSPWPAGDGGSVMARVVAPSEPGRYRLRWELVRDGVAWFGPPRFGAAAAWVEVTAPGLSWALVDARELRHHWVHRQGALPVVLRNTGSEPWSAEHGDRLSYRWYDERGRALLEDGLRTALPGPVEPGQEVALSARVRGPPRPGRYTLHLEMVREHVRWYGPPSGGRASFEVRVERWSSYWIVLLGAAGLAMVVMVRRGPSSSRARWWLWRTGPALWTGAAVAALVHAFVDFSGAEPWEGMALVAVGPAPAAVVVLLPWSARTQAWGGALLAAGLSALALADLSYLHFFGSIVPPGAVAALHHLSDAGSTVSSLLEPAHAWLFVLPAVSVGLAVAWPRGVGRAAPAGSRWGLMGLAAASVALTVPLGLALRAAFGSGLDQRVFSERDNVRRLGVVGAHVFAGLRELSAWLGPRALSVERRDALARATVEAAERREVASARAPGFGAARGFDVLLVQVEALQGWAVDAQVDGQPVMPFLAEASGQALYFDEVFDQTAQGRTSDAEYLVLGAGHPLARGALAFLHADNDFYTLAHVLADAGYATTSAHPYARGFWNRAQLHPRYGFARSRFRRELGPGPRIGWGLSDAAFFERMAPEVLASPTPSLTFLITLSLHHPYEDFPAAFKTLELGALEGDAVGNYLHAMHHFDGALERLLAALREGGRLHRTLVVIYGDHVTGMGEPPAVLALAGRPAWDPSAHVALHRVPVFMWVGDDAGPRLRGRRSVVGGQIDIGATVLHLLGIDDPRPAAWGRTLMDPAPGFAALPNGGAVDSSWIFVARGRGIPRGGGCFERSGPSVPRERCEPLRRRARQELEDARSVLDHNLHRAGASR